MVRCSLDSRAIPPLELPSLKASGVLRERFKVDSIRTTTSGNIPEEGDRHQRWVFWVEQKFRKVSVLTPSEVTHVRPLSQVLRLCTSGRHGVGVFATRRIAGGEVLYKEFTRLAETRLAPK